MSTDTIVKVPVSAETPLEALIKIRDHLLHQGQQSMNGKVCAYRGEDDTRCAVGALIDNDDACRFWDQIGQDGDSDVSSITSESYVSAYALPDEVAYVLDVTDTAMLTALQQAQVIHDIGSNWVGTGLTDEAVAALDRLIRKYRKYSR